MATGVSGGTVDVCVPERRDDIGVIIFCGPRACSVATIVAAVFRFFTGELVCADCPQSSASEACFLFMFATLKGKASRDGWCDLRKTRQWRDVRPQPGRADCALNLDPALLQLEANFASTSRLEPCAHCLLDGRQIRLHATGSPNIEVESIVMGAHLPTG